MPRLSVLFIRTGLVYLATGFTLGGLLLFNKGLPIVPALWAVLPAHIEFLLIGWTLQLIMGVAFWILPRFSRSPLRGKESLAWLSYYLLNLGVWLVILSSLFPQWNGFSIIGRVAETASAVAFALHAWPRIKPLGVG